MTSWPLVPLKSVATIERSVVDPRRLAEGTQYVGLEDIPSGGGQVRPVTLKNGDLASAKFRFGPEHVLFGKLRPYLAKVVSVDFAGICSTDILPIRPGPGIDREYLRHYLLQPSVVARAASLATGANLPRLSPASLESFLIPLPHLPEQRRIADILCQADGLRTKRRQALDELDALAQSIFLDMFGSRTLHDGVWTTVTDLAAGGDSIRTGPFGSQLLHSEFQPEGIAVLGIDSAVNNEFRWVDGRCISEAKYQQLKRYTVRPGDVLITIMGTCGRCAVVPDGLPPAINTKHLCCITLDKTKALPEFLQAYFLWHPVAQRYLVRAAKGAIMPGLNMGIIKALPVPVIPLEDQATFAARRGACQHSDRH